MIQEFYSSQKCWRGKKSRIIENLQQYIRRLAQNLKI